MTTLFTSHLPLPPPKMFQSTPSSSQIADFFVIPPVLEAINHLKLSV